MATSAIIHAPTIDDITNEGLDMSQTEVYKIIKELGGRASTSEIKKRAKSKFPDLSLHLYVNNRLAQLEKFGFIRREVCVRVTTWTVVDGAHYPDEED